MAEAAMCDACGRKVTTKGSVCPRCQRPIPVQSDEWRASDSESLQMLARIVVPIVLVVVVILIILANADWTGFAGL